MAEGITEAEVPQAAIVAAIVAVAGVYGDRPETALAATSSKYRRSKSAVGGALWQLGFGSAEIGARVGLAVTGPPAVARDERRQIMTAVAAALDVLEAAGVTRRARARTSNERPLGFDLASDPQGDCARHLKAVRKALGGMRFPVMAIPARAHRCAELGPG